MNPYSIIKELYFYSDLKTYSFCKYCEYGSWVDWALDTKDDEIEKRLLEISQMKNYYGPFWKDCEKYTSFCNNMYPECGYENIYPRHVWSMEILNIGIII